MFRAVADSPLSCLDYLFCRSSCFYHRSCRFIHFNAQSSRNPVVEQNPLVFDIFSLPYKHYKEKTDSHSPYSELGCLFFYIFWTSVISREMLPLKILFCFLLCRISREMSKIIFSILFQKTRCGYFPGNAENFLLSFSFGYGIKNPGKVSITTPPFSKQSSSQSISREIQTEEKSLSVLSFTVLSCPKVLSVLYSAFPAPFLPVLPCDGRGLPLRAESTAAPLQTQSKAVCCKPNQTLR